MSSKIENDAPSIALECHGIHTCHKQPFPKYYNDHVDIRGTVLARKALHCAERRTQPTRGKSVAMPAAREKKTRPIGFKFPQLMPSAAEREKAAGYPSGKIPLGAPHSVSISLDQICYRKYINTIRIRCFSFLIFLNQPIKQKARKFVISFPVRQRT
jgi:hypothetical protein